MVTRTTKKSEDATEGVARANMEWAGVKAKNFQEWFKEIQRMAAS
jgi:hypothetical protein